MRNIEIAAGLSLAPIERGKSRLRTLPTIVRFVFMFALAFFRFSSAPQ